MTVDETSAFDCIVPEILLNKLKIYNFGEDEITWFKDILSFRTQYITIGGKNLSMRQINSGVPQGSVLGPVLYMLYMNELPETLMRPDNCQNVVHKDHINLFSSNCEHCGVTPNYADDATIVAVSNTRLDNQSRLDENLTRMQSFLNKNGLTMNKKKTTLVESMVCQKRTRLRGEPP